MTTFNTGNPLGSTDVYDRYDNSENLDNFSNGPLDAYPDRFGVSRQSLQGIRNASQYVDLGPYAAGLVFTSRNQVFSYLGEFYAPGPAITLPYTTTGVGAGEIANFRSVGDAILRSDLAAPAPGKGAALLGTKQPGSTLARSQLDKNAERYYLADFPGVDLSGVTDSTVGVQAAVDYCAANGIDLHTGRGVVLVSTVQVKTGSTIKGAGIGKFTFKRLPSAATGYALEINGVIGVKLADFTVDGNKADAVNGGNNILIAGSSSNYVLDGIESKNAKSVSGFGSGILAVGAPSGTQSGISYIKNCQVTDNQGTGITVQRVSGLTVTDNYVYMNGGAGIDIINFVFPPLADVANDLEISRNRCNYNLIGIRGLGYYRGGSSGAPIYGIEIPQSRHVNIIGNHCNFNTEYGIAWQCANGIIANNHVNRNGVNQSQGGILLNGFRTQVLGNNLEDNYYYGIDAGCSINCTISNNIFVRTGATAGLGSNDINLGAAQSVIVEANQIDQTGVTGACIAIGAPRWDGDGSKFFPTIAQNLDIIDNIVQSNADARSVGVYLRQGPVNIKIHGNRVRGAALGRDFITEVLGLVQGLNFSSNWLAVTGVPAAGATAAATTVIPDIADTVYVSGGTTITRLHTLSANNYYQKLYQVNISAAGSGYTTAPSVSFSGGGGTGAAGTALIGSDGTIIGVEITNHGSGYTSAPSVSFSGGGGAGAAGAAVVGCDNFATRQVTLLFQNGVTVTDGGNLALAGSLVATAGSTLTLLGYAGSWQEVSRAIV